MKRLVEYTTYNGTIAYVAVDKINSIESGYDDDITCIFLSGGDVLKSREPIKDIANRVNNI